PLPPLLRHSRNPAVSPDYRADAPLCIGGTANVQGDAQMTTKDNGGAAFPHRGWDGPNDQFAWPESGMTLRDYFAANAPWARASFLADPEDGAVDRVAALMAKKAYAFADAMIAERSK